MDETTRAILHRESGLSSKDFSSFYEAAKISIEAERRQKNGGEIKHNLERWVDQYVDAYAGPVVWGEAYRRWRYPDDRSLIRKFVRKVVLFICSPNGIERSEKEPTRPKGYHRGEGSYTELDLSSNQSTISVAPPRGEPSSTIPEEEKEKDRERPPPKKSLPGKRRSQPPRGAVSKRYVEPDLDDLVYPDIPTPAPATKRKRIPLPPVAPTPTKEASTSKRRKLLPPPPQFPPPVTEAHPPREPEKRSFSPPPSPPATITTATTSPSEQPPPPPSSPHPRVFKTYIAGSPSIKLIHVEDFSPAPTMRAFLEHLDARWGAPVSGCDTNVEVEVAGERYECREERDWKEVLEMVREGQEERVVVRVDGGV